MNEQSIKYVWRFLSAYINNYRQHKEMDCYGYLDAWLVSKRSRPDTRAAVYDDYELFALAIALLLDDVTKPLRKALRDY